MGASSSSSSTHVRALGQMLSPSTVDLKASSSQSHPGSTTKEKGSFRGAVEQPLAVMPITIWNPLAQSVKPPSSRSEKLKRKGFETGEDGDSLLLNAELAVGTVSSILKDYDLKRSGSLPVEEALALSL